MSFKELNLKTFDFLDFVELVKKHGMGTLGSHVARRVFRTIDKNKNGQLDAKEVSSAMDIINKLFNKVLHVDAI